MQFSIGMVLISFHCALDIDIRDAHAIIFQFDIDYDGISLVCLIPLNCKHGNEFSNEKEMIIQTFMVNSPKHSSPNRFFRPLRTVIFMAVKFSKTVVEYRTQRV